MCKLSRRQQSVKEENEVSIRGVYKFVGDQKKTKNIFRPAGVRNVDIT